MLDHHSQKATAGQVFNTNIGEFQLGDSRPEFTDLWKWNELAEDLSFGAPAVARFSAQQLQARWLNGMACIATDVTRIVAYTSLIPVENRRASQLRGRVFEASSGWTLPGYRRMGLQLKMRRQLYEPFTEDLLISFCMGMGASMVLQRLGWHLIPWDRPDCLSELVGRVRDGTLHHRLGDSISLEGRQVFNAASPSDDHDWHGSLHLWASNT